MNGNIQRADNIRELLGHLIGQKLMEITQQDKDEDGDPYVELLFEKGNTLKFFLADGEDYECGFPFCFSDPDPNAPEDDGFFHPDPADEEAHKWAAVVELTPKGEVLHVIPCFGKLHHIGEECWCNPRKDFRDDGSWSWVHEEIAE